MKKIIILIAIQLGITTLHAQVDPIRQKLDSIFQYVNKSQVPTGYLKEFGAEMMPLHWFKGVMTDTNFVANIDAFRFIYHDLSTAKIQSALPLMTDLLTVNSTIDNLRNGTAKPIAVLYGSYASLRDDALSQNLFTISNQQVFDVAGRTQNPYLTNTIFAAAPITEKFRDTVRLSFNAALSYSNTTMTVSSVSIDFKDGQGYQLIPANGMVTKIYTDSSSTKPIDIKAQLSSGGFVYCHSSVDVTVTLNGTSNRYLGTDPYAREVAVPTVAGEGLGGDVMQIRYSVNNPTRTMPTPHLRKPLIMVEGYDVSGQYNVLNLIKNSATDPQKGEWINLFNISGYDFMKDLDDTAGYDLVFINYNTLRSFEDNSKMLQHAIEWIKQDKTAGGYTNLNVIIGVSAGGILARYTLAKMTKTISSASTDTRMLITHDSPHQGANVPLGFQHFLYDLGKQKILGIQIKDNLDDLKNFYTLNTLPATAQLLKARVVDESGTVSINTFLNGPQSPYKQMVTYLPGDNVPTYSFKATAQGSQCGIPVMPTDGLLLADFDDVFSIVNFKWFYLPTMYKTKYFLKTQLNALPSSGVAQIEYFKYSRRFSIWGVGLGTKTINEYTRQNPAGFVKWDAAPGSTQSIADRTNGALNTGLDKQKLPWYATPFVKVRAGLNMNVSQDLFSFVSTTSALDAPLGTPLNNVYIFPFTGTNATTTQKYIAQENFSIGTATYYNRNHTDFTARNAKWIYNEMENLANIEDCSTECIPSWSISGPDVVCTSGIYTILNVPLSATVTWSASSYYTVTSLNSNASQVSIAITNSGTTSLTATVQLPGSSCYSSFSTSLNKQLKMGAPNATSFTPNITQGSSTNYMSNYCNKLTFVCSSSARGGALPDDIIVGSLSISPYNYCASGYITDANATSITWSMVQRSPGTFHGYYNFTGNQFNVGINLNYPLEWVVLRCTRTNECGSATSDYRFYAGNGICIGEIEELSNPAEGAKNSSTENVVVEVYPNPSSGSMKVSLLDKEQKSTIKKIIISNKMGVNIYNQTFNNNQSFQNLQIKVPATDIYSIHVYNGYQWVVQKISLLRN